MRLELIIEKSFDYPTLKKGKTNHFKIELRNGILYRYHKGETVHTKWLLHYVFSTHLLKCIAGF